MSSLPKLCPNCGGANPSQVTICRNCGFSFEQKQHLPRDTRQTAKVVLSRTSFPLALEVISDWLGIFFSLGFHLKRFLNDRRGWIKFIIDVLAVAVISGFTLLLSFTFTANIDNKFSNEIRDIRLDFGIEGDTQFLLSGILFAFGSSIGTIIYLLIVHYTAIFFGGKGDLFDHLHMNLSVDVIYNLILPISFIAGAINIFAFLAVAGSIVLYRIFLQVRVIQVVHQIPFVFALLAALVAPMIFSCVWLPVSM